MDMNKMAIIGAGINQWEKTLQKKEDNLRKWTDKLIEAHHNDTSITRRSNLRIKIDNLAEEIREAKNVLKTGKEMKKELMKKT